jgi:hypothetical protein
MGRASGTYGREEKWIWIEWGSLNECDPMKDLDVGARVILKYNFHTQYGRA